MGKKLGEICKFQSGGTPTKGNAEYFGGCIPWITTTALNGGIINESNAVDWITEKAIAESAAKIVPAFSIMVGTRVGIGKVAVNSVDMSTSQDIISLVGIDDSVWSKDYLCKFIQGKGTYLNSQARGATIKGIKIDVLAALELPNVSFAEQEYVSRTIDSVKKIISSRRRQLQQLDELVKARFVEMFGDPVSTTKKKKKLSDIGRTFTGNTPSMKNPEYYDSDDIPFVKPGDIVEGEVTRIKQVDSFISENARNIARIIPTNAVLVTCIGTIGKIGIAAQECCCNQQINYIVPNDSINSVYLAYCISFFKEVLAAMANAPVVPIINKTQFSALEIPVAEYGEQIQFAEFVEQADKSKVAAHKALEEAQLLFDSLMQKYFG